MSWLDTMATNAGINKDYTQHEQDTATNSANGEKSLYDKKLLNIGPFNFSGKEIMDASQSLLDSAASVYGNIAYEFGNPYGIGDTLRNYAQQHEQAMGENTQPGFNYDYIMNGGLLRDTGTLAGSVLSLAPVGAVAAGGAAALGASAPVVGAAGGIASALGEAAAEGGGTLADSLAQGLSLDEAESRAREVTGKNALFLGATNALSGGMMGNFLKGVARNIAGKGASELADGIASQSGLISQGTKETLKGAGTLGLSALNEGFQEAEQDAISASVDPNKYASYNPIYWSDEQWEDFKRTIGPTALMGFVGGASGNASYNAGLARQNEMQEPEQTSSQVNDMTNTPASSIPAQANYTIADEVSDANLSQGTESKLRMLDEAYYNQYGQHLYVTSMTRHWGTNSDHETGSAFDVADDGLANDSERRQWIAEKARQLGLNPLDEYENPSSGATGGHMHFSDKGGAVNVDTSGWSGNADIDNLINENANKYGVDAALLAAIAEQESGFNQGSQSEAGAVGIMQLMPPTAEGLGVDATDLAGNIEGGAKYIRQMLDQFGGDVHKALEAYNGGPGGVGTAQTMKYADEVMQRYEKFKTKSAGTFSWSNPAEAKTSPTDYMKIMSDNNVTADTAGDFLQYVQLLAEDDANANNEQVQKDGAKAVKAIADGSPDVMESAAKELGYGQVKQEAEQKAPNIPMPKIKQHVQQNGWVEIGNKKDADEFARTDYGKTLERVSNTKFVSPDFNAITGKVEQRTAQPQQVAQPAPQPTVQNKVQSDVASTSGQNIANNAAAANNETVGPLLSSIPNSAISLAKTLSQNPAAISYNGNNVDLNKLNNAIKNNDVKTINGFNAHMMNNMRKNNVSLDDVVKEHLPVAKDTAMRLSKIPEAITDAVGNRVDLRALQEAINNNDLNRINAISETMAENLRSNGVSPYLAMRDTESEEEAPTGSTLPAVQGNRAPSTNVQDLGWRVEGEVESPIAPPAPYTEAQLEAPAIEPERDTLTSQEFLGKLNNVERQFMEYLDSVFDNTGVAFVDIMQHLNSQRNSLLGKAIEMFKNGYAVDSVVFSRMNDTQRSALVNYRRMLDVYGNSLTNADRDVIDEFTRLDNIINEYLTPMAHNYLINNNVLNYRGIDNAIKGLEGIAAKAREYEQIKVSEGYREGRATGNKVVSREDEEAISGSATAWGNVLHQTQKRGLPAETEGTKVQRFIKTLPNKIVQKSHSNSLNAMTNYAGEKITKAERVERVIKNGDSIQKIENEYFVVAPSGNIKVTKSEYNYYNYLLNERKNDKSDNSSKEHIGTSRETAYEGRKALTESNYKRGDVSVPENASNDKIGDLDIKTDGLNEIYDRNVREKTKSTVITDDGREFNVVYKLMSADDVVASNLPTDGLPVNSKYPSAMQPRNRQRVAMQEQITSMSNNLRPADLAESRNLNQGAPVIKSDGAVLNGNGRTIAIQRAWLNSKADKYKQYLLDNAEKLGINPADIEGIEHPILVRVVQDKLSKDDIMSMINSTTGGQRMSPSEQAKVDSKKIKASTLNKYVAGSDVTAAANRSFLRDVLADIVAPSERNAYYSREGAINQDGVLRAQRALFALAYGDDTLLDAFSEAVNEEAKNFSNALKANAPLVARLQQLINSGNANELGLQKNLTAAVKALKGAVLEGKPAQAIWQEMSMFENTEHSPETIAIAKVMDGYRRSGKKLTQFVRNLAELGLKHGNPNQSGLFGENEAPQIKLTDDIATAKEYVDTGKQMDLFTSKYSRDKNSRSAFFSANPDTAEELKATGNIGTPLDRLPKLPASKLRDSERKMQAFGKAIGVPVHFVNHPDKGYRGVFTHNGEVYINRNATVPAKAIFLHEFTHWLKASGKENRAVFDALAACVERDGGLFHERRLKQYRDRIFGGEQMTDEEIIEEIICDAMGNSKTAERISKAIDNFAPELNQSIWGRIKAMWDKFCKMVGFRQELSSKKQSLPNGLSQQEMARFNAQLNTLMSKMRTADGKPMFKVENYQLVVADNNQRPAEMFDINNINDYTPTYNIPAMPSSYSYQVHTQREAVRQQYEGTNEWMKAPNGESTNLTEEQWLDVRTPNFKAWFGDWENNPENASKVVDENGEPLVVYHGSESNFDEFDTAKARANMDIQGMFFSPIQEEANDYGENVRAFFLNIKNPADYDTGYNALKNHKGENLAGEKARNDLMENGYDGVNNDGEEYIAFNPNQIKSATENTGAFSPDTNNIKYSRGRAGMTASTNNVGIFKRAMTALENKLKGKMPDNLDVRTYEDIETDRENARRAKAASRGKEYLDRSKEVSPLGQWWASPSRFAKKIPLISPFVQMGKIAVDKQEKLRVEFNAGMNEIEDMLGYSKWGSNDKKYKERKMALQEALLQGDIARKVFTDDELKSGGLDEQTIKAYHKMRELLDKAYNMADQTYSRTKYVSRNWSTAAEADGFMNDLMKKNPFVQIIQKKQNADGTVTYTYKEPHQYTVSALTVTEAELDELKKNKDVIITSEKHIYGDMFGNSTYRVTYHQKQANLGKIQGYIPHIFHGWLVCEVDKNGNIIKDSAGNIVVATSKNSMSEAVKEGKKIASQNTGKRYMVMPKLGKFSDGAAERAAIMGDFAYSKTMSKVANGMKMSIADAERFMKDTVSVQNRGRFLAYAQHRKGVQGYEQNVFLATQMYFNQIARYVALDPFKRDAISMYNRLFGSFTDNTVTRRSENAKYVYAYINDMNGMPSGFEKWANKMLHNMGLGQEVANGRPTLWLERMIFTYPFTIAKLGVFNVSSALLNLTQLFNLYGAMGEKVLSSAGYERLLKKGFMDARKAIVDKNSPLGQLVWKDLGLEAQIGIDVAGGYSRTEVNGLASLTGRLSKLAGGSMYLFRLSDTYTRAVTLLTAYNKALDEGKTKQEAIEYAKEINDKVNFDYSVADSPAIFRVGGPLSNVLLQFQKYPVKQIELFMDIFNDGREAGLNRKQSALRLMKYVAPYMAFSGMMGIPFISLAGGILSAIMSAATGDDDWDWQQKIKQYMVETFGADNPLTLWWLYGAGSFIGINVGSRVGVGAFMGIENREKSPIDSILGMTTATSTVAQTAKQLGYGNYAEAVKAISPSAGNILIGLKGEVHTTRGRMKYQYQNAYEQALRMIGLTPLNETMAGDIASNDYANKQAEKRAKDDAIDSFLDEPTAENAARLNELGVTPKSIQTEMARRKMNRAELNRIAEEEKAAKAKKSKQKKKQYSVNDYLKGK